MIRFVVGLLVGATIGLGASVGVAKTDEHWQIVSGRSCFPATYEAASSDPHPVIYFKCPDGSTVGWSFRP